MPRAGDNGGDQPPRPSTGRQRLWFWLKIVLSLALLAYLLRGGDVEAVWAALAGADPVWVAGAFVLYVCSHLLNAVRWHRYARELGLGDGNGDFLRLYFVGLFVNLFAPGTIAGDVARGVGVSAEGGRKAALAGVVLHRLTGLVALMMLAGAAALAQTEYPLSGLAVAVAVALPVSSVALLFGAPVVAKAGVPVFGRDLAVPAQWAPATGRTLVLAVCYHALQIASMLLLGRGLALGVAAATLSLFVPLANAAGMVPVTVSGIGVREAVYVFLLGTVGVAPEDSIALGLLGSGLVLAAGITGAPAFLATRRTGSRRIP